MKRHQWGVVCTLALGCVGCDAIRLKTVDTQDTVISRRSDLLPGGGALARAQIDGATVYVETFRSCDVVEMQQVRRVEIREEDEDLPEEFALLTLSSVPITTGAVLIADAPNVYDADRNAKQYNATGGDDVYIIGGVLIGVGSLIAVPVLVQLFRVAAAGEERVSVVDKRGDVLAGGVPCEGRMQPLRTSVRVIAGGKQVHAGYSDGNGKLVLNLAQLIPSEVANRETVASVSVGNNVIAEVDMALVRAAKADRPDAPVMATEPPAACAASCAEVCVEDEACRARCRARMCPEPPKDEQALPPPEDTKTKGGTP